MDDYRQPDTPETANEVEMLLDQQAEQAVSSEVSKETSADMKQSRLIWKKLCSQRSS